MPSPEKPLHTQEHSHSEHEHSQESRHGSLEKPKNKEETSQNRAPEHPKHNLEAIHDKIEHTAHSQAELKPKYKEKTHENHTVHATQSLKSHMLQRTLVRTRKHLNKPDQVLSKVVHNPAVNKISELSEKTIARPPSLLAGSITAFIGISVFYYLSKHYGFAYNWLLIILLFISGYILGYIFELATTMWRKTRN